MLKLTVFVHDDTPAAFESRVNEALIELHKKEAVINDIQYAPLLESGETYLSALIVYTPNHE